MRDRRAMFFLLAALVCVLLLPLAADDFRWITLGRGGHLPRCSPSPATSTSAAAAEPGHDSDTAKGPAYARRVLTSSNDLDAQERRHG